MSNNNSFLYILGASACLLIPLVILVFRVGGRLFNGLLRLIFPSFKRGEEAKKRAVQNEREIQTLQAQSGAQKKEELDRIENSHWKAPQKAIYCYDTDLHTTARNANSSFAREIFLVGKWINTETTDDSYVRWNTDEDGRPTGQGGYYQSPATMETRFYQFDTQVRVAIHLCPDCMNKRSSKRAVTRVA